MEAGLFDVLSGRFADGRRIESVRAEEQQVLSIISNLIRLLNTRRGAIRHLPDYGLPDISEIYRDMPDSVTKLQTAIEQAIEKYEPRLQRVRVEYHDTDPFAMRLTFLLSGERMNRQKVQLQTVFSSHELASVRSWQPS